MTTSTGLHVGTRVRSLVDDGMFVTVGLEGVVWLQHTRFATAMPSRRAVITWDNGTRSAVPPNSVEVIE